VDKQSDADQDGNADIYRHIHIYAYGYCNKYGDQDIDKYACGNSNRYSSGSDSNGYSSGAYSN